MLISAGRDHRVRLWEAESGLNTLTHFSGARNPASACKQLAVCAERGTQARRSSGAALESKALE